MSTAKEARHFDAKSVTLEAAPTQAIHSTAATNGSEPELQTLADRHKPLFDGLVGGRRGHQEDASHLSSSGEAQTACH
jgi:hypothetical protein